MQHNLLIKMSIDEEIISVPVPKSRLAEVYRLLGSAPTSARPTVLAHEPQGWDPPSIERLWRGSDKSAKALLGFLADQPGVEVSVNDVKEEVGAKGGRGVGGLVGALRRRCRNRLQRDLPFEKHWDPESGTRYVMSEEIARLIAAVRET
jgi:Family of unknown function (DUF6416)